MLSGFAVEDFDAGWLRPQVSMLFLPHEKAALLRRVQDEVLPDLEYHIDMSADGHAEDVTPESRYESASDVVKAYGREFRDEVTLSQLRFAEEYIARSIEYAAMDYQEPRGPRFAEKLDRDRRANSTRDMFEDVAEGR
jgi:hypothetical protein